ncbi:hypothetical protein PENSTE_c016G09610 [Penicillium steckii]|uniref:Uncharacterized protein n=1 Tax=Penicillium steckii TaxID=303698 RepID=A0A1V6SYW8_9EURO|nr:hypothetical protein PENSTE_c016G09610 [Penicillium steckii]
MSREKAFQPGEKTSDRIPSETHANSPAPLVNGIGEAEAAIAEKGASSPAAAAATIAVPMGTRPRAEEGYYRSNVLSVPDLRRDRLMIDPVPVDDLAIEIARIDGTTVRAPRRIPSFPRRTRSESPGRASGRTEREV